MVLWPRANAANRYAAKAVETYMRQIATVRSKDPNIRRVMICSSSDGHYLFLYNQMDDCPCCADELFDSVQDALEDCESRFAIAAEDWKVIPDPPSGCQADWIRPTRIRRDSKGQPIHGEFEPAPD